MGVAANEALANASTAQSAPSFFTILKPTIGYFQVFRSYRVVSGSSTVSTVMVPLVPSVCLHRDPAWINTHIIATPDATFTLNQQFLLSARSLYIRSHHAAKVSHLHRLRDFPPLSSQFPEAEGVEGG